MSTTLTSEAIIFAIRSGLKLSSNLRRIYANELKSKELTLPLPKFDGEMDVFNAETFFKDKDPITGGARYLTKYPGLQELHSKQLEEVLENDSVEGKKYLKFYNDLKCAEKTDPLKNGKISEVDILTPEDTLAFLQVRQWTEGSEDLVTPLQLVAGTLIEIGIDYFLQVPGAMATNTPYSRALRRFMEGIDGVELGTDKGAFKRLADQFVPRLFITAADTLQELGDHITKDEKFQEFIKITSSGVAQKVHDKLKENILQDSDEVVNWGEMVLGSMIRSAGDFAFSDPKSVFGTNEPVSEIIQSTGLTLLSAILDDKNEKIELKKAFTPETIDRVTKASLKVISEHPRFLSKHFGISHIITDVADAMSESSITRPDLLPEMVRLILEHTAGNIDLLQAGRDGRAQPPEDGKPGRRLLTLTIKELLNALSRKDDDKPWRPHLGKTHILGIANSLLDEVIDNPGWILAEKNDKPVLREVLDSVFAALADIPDEHRFSGKTIEIVLHIGLRTAANTEQVLSKIHFSGAPNAESGMKTILNHALDIVFDFVFSTGDITPASRINFLVNVTEYVLESVLVRNPNENGLVLLKMILFDGQQINYGGGFNRELADQIMESSLQVLAGYPGLVTKDEILQNLLVEVAGTMRQHGLREPGLLASLLQLSLDFGSRNTMLLLKTDHDDPSEPRYLLSLAIRELLAALALSEDEEVWRPQLGGSQILGIAEDVFGALVVHPEWVTDKVGEKTVLHGVLSSIFDAVKTIPQGQRLSSSTFQMLIRISLQDAVIGKTDLDDPAKSLLNQVLELTLSHIFPPGQTPRPDGERLLLDILEYLMERILAGNPDSKGLLLAELILEEAAFFDFAGGFNPDMAEDLKDAALLVISQQAELVTGKRVLQELVVGVAGTLQTYDKPGLFPEIIRMTLEMASQELSILILENPDEPDKPGNVLLIALQQVLEALAAPNSKGKWKPKLSEEQILDIVDLMLGQVMENPQWVIKDEILLNVTKAVMHALESAPMDAKITHEVVKAALVASVEAVSFRKQWGLNIEGRRTLAIKISLEGLVIELYSKNKGKPASWTLTQTPVITAIIEAFLTGLASKPAKQESIDAAMAHILEAVTQLNDNAEFVLEDLLQKLEQGVTIEEEI